MPLLVDGDNLLGTWRGRRRSDAERRNLVYELNRLGRSSRRRIVIIFDGTRPPGLDLGADVRFSGRGRSADDLILEFMREQSDPRGWTVVTSDRSLGDQCRYVGARIERSDSFRKCLLGRSDAEKPEHEDEIELWLERFEEQGE